MKNLVLEKEVIELRLMSFYIESEAICEIISLYMKTQDGTWVKLTIDDGYPIIEREEKEPKIVLQRDISDEFAYPIRLLEGNQFISSGKIKDVREYLWNGQRDECCGILLSFENGSDLSIIEGNGCLRLLNGIDTSLLENCELVESR